MLQKRIIHFHRKDIFASEERIKRLDEALEKFRDSIDKEVDIVRDSYPSLCVRGALVRTNQGDDSSLSNIAHDTSLSDSREDPSSTSSSDAGISSDTSSGHTSGLFRLPGERRLLIGRGQ